MIQKFIQLMRKILSHLAAFLGAAALFPYNRGQEIENVFIPKVKNNSFGIGGYSHTTKRIGNNRKRTPGRNGKRNKGLQQIQKESRRINYLKAKTR